MDFELHNNAYALYSFSDLATARHIELRKATYNLQISPKEHDKCLPHFAKSLLTNLHFAMITGLRKYECTGHSYFPTFFTFCTEFFFQYTSRFQYLSSFCCVIIYYDIWHQIIAKFLSNHDILVSASMNFVWASLNFEGALLNLIKLLSEWYGLHLCMNIKLDDDQRT